MKWMRLLSGEAYKGTRNYLNTQRVYEILRTILFFAISLALFIAGWLSTGSRLNLLTIVAILGLMLCDLLGLICRKTFITAEHDGTYHRLARGQDPENGHNGQQI